jgi:rhamnogalacturonyl hydrolase YesR
MSGWTLLTTAAQGASTAIETRQYIEPQHRKIMINRLAILLVISSCAFQSLPAREKTPVGFPEGSTPEEVGRRLSNNFIGRGHMFYEEQIHYAEVCTWFGALKYAEAVNDTSLIRKLQERFEPLFAAEKQYLPQKTHVDWNMFGSLPLELYKITKDKIYYDLGMPYADSQWEVPEEAAPEGKTWAGRGFSWQTRLWIDDMFMITIIQSQAYKATGDRKYIDRAAREMALYLDKLQRPDGLFYHSPDAPFYWARGNGWMAAGMTELLRHLPEDNADRPRILAGYRLMMDSLKEFQTTKGMWNQLIDAADCWAETSGTAMFAYARISGVKHGWLKQEEFELAALRAWLALIPYIDREGNVTEVCVGTGTSSDRRHYYNRPRATGDFHGQAPVLWCAYAWLERNEN